MNTLIGFIASLEEVLKHVASADLAWCSRDAYFESQTRELSTKVLECLLMGTPPILTRSILHEDLLGQDYPFFVEGPNDLSWNKDLVSKLQKRRSCYQIWRAN